MSSADSSCPASINPRSRTGWLMGSAVCLSLSCSGASDTPFPTPTATGGTVPSVSGSSMAGGVLGNGGAGSLGGSSATGGNSTSGGSVSVGGSSNGGASNGGASNGGASNGGASNGGASNGGASNGGAVTGGSTSGGTGTGGTATGGKAAGGANIGGASTGGAPAGGTSTAGAAIGGASTGGKATGGAKSGGAATGGAATGGRATGGAATGGAATGGATSTGTVFNQCRFHFGTLQSIATRSTNTPSMIPQLDFFTPGWMVTNFEHSSTCTLTAPGGALAGLVPVVVDYIAAQYAKFSHGLCDCNVTTCGTTGGRANDLCNYGAQYITQDWAAILGQIDNNSTGFANCLGGRPIIFEMEPDWYQYTYTSQTQPWSAATAGTNMTTLVTRLGAKLPQARFSMDASPWVGPVNGSDGGAAWWSNFNMSLFTFVSTSGGGTNAATQQCGGTPSATNPAGAIRCNNYMTWANLNAATGKPILADTGYGAEGTPAGPDPNWDLPANINARMADGVISICQYGPSTSWGATIAGIRGQLNAPKYCP